MAPTVDFTGVSDEYEPLPEGKYPANLDSWEYRPSSKTSGEPYVALAFRVREGEFEGRKLFRNQSVQRQSLWSFKRTLVRLGVDPDELAGPLDLEDVMPAVAGAPCVLDVGQHLYDGTIRNNIKDILSDDEIA